MSIEADVEKDLIDRLLANLPTGFTSSIVKLPNAAFTTPNGKWLRATKTDGVVIDRDASNCFKQYEGIFVVDVFYPKLTGSIAAQTTADLIRAKFENVQLTNCFCSNVDVAVPGEEENWYHAQVNVTYLYETYSTL